MCMSHELFFAVLSPAIPSDTAELAQYQKEMICATRRFEEEMTALGLVQDSLEQKSSSPPSAAAASALPTTEAEASPLGMLSRFVVGVDNQFALKKQKKILNRARSLLLNQETNACLKEVCTVDLIPDVSDLLSFRSAMPRSRGRSQRKAATADGPQLYVRDEGEDCEEEKESPLRTAKPDKNEEKMMKPAESKESDIFLFNMPRCQVP